MKTVIVAAGLGSRLWRKTYKKPKTLLPFGDGSILSTIMGNFHKVGINDFVIVVGFEADYIEEYLDENKNFGYNIEFIQNSDWEKGNGISVLVSEPVVKNEDFILTMSDHIVPVDALQRICEYKSGHNLLLVDPKTDKVFDIDDATKVKLDNNMIINIGKEIIEYNGIDCGIFKLNDKFFKSMRLALDDGKDSISAAINILISNNDMEAVFMKDQEMWADIDTPADYEHLKKLFGK